MVNCEKCFHNKVCQRKHAVCYLKSLVDFCGLFLDKDLIIELPCKVGEEITVQPTKENGLKEDTVMKCIDFSISEANNTVNLINDKNKLFQPSFEKVKKWT